MTVNYKNEAAVTEVTKEFLLKWSACKDGYQYWINCNKPNLFEFIDQAQADDRWNWANWLIVRCMTRQQYLAYAIFSAEQVIEIYEKRSPGKDIPRRAIEAAKQVLRDDSPQNRKAAAAADAAAADADDDAAAAAYVAAYAAAYTAAADAYADDAAYAAAAAAYAAADAAAAAAAAAADAAAAYAAAAAAAAARKVLRSKILIFGIKLMGGPGL